MAPVRLERADARCGESNEEDRGGNGPACAVNGDTQKYASDRNPLSSMLMDKVGDRTGDSLLGSPGCAACFGGVMSKLACRPVDIAFVARNDGERIPGLGFVSGTEHSFPLWTLDGGSSKVEMRRKAEPLLCKAGVEGRGLVALGRADGGVVGCCAESSK